MHFSKQVFFFLKKVGVGVSFFICYSGRRYKVWCFYHISHFHKACSRCLRHDPAACRALLGFGTADTGDSRRGTRCIPDCFAVGHLFAWSVMAGLFVDRVVRLSVARPLFTCVFERHRHPSCTHFQHPRPVGRVSRQRTLAWTSIPTGLADHLHEVRASRRS